MMGVGAWEPWRPADRPMSSTMEARRPTGVIDPEAYKPTCVIDHGGREVDLRHRPWRPASRFFGRGGGWGVGEMALVLGFVLCHKAKKELPIESNRDDAFWPVPTWEQFIIANYGNSFGKKRVQKYSDIGSYRPRPPRSL